MKKLKVMYEKPEVTEEELNKFMDFDQLLVKQTALQKQQRIQYILGTVSIIAVVALITWWMVPSMDDSTTPILPADVAEVTEPNQNGAATVDSVTLEETKTVNKSVLDKTPVLPKSRNENPKTGEIKKNEEQVPVYRQSEPVNGYANLYAYFEKELIYPQEAIADSIQGTVTVHCTINKEGKPVNIQIENSLGEAFDKEVVRIISNMPAWKPATFNEVPMDSKISIPLSFNLKPVSHD